jgi:glycosyltransferase involved in cell wall biosynthesis
VDQLAHSIVLLDQVFRQASAFDLIHFHIDYLHFPLSVRQQIPHVTTLHGRLDIPDLGPVYQAFPSVPVVSISDHQRAPLPWLQWQGTVYHGLPEDLYTFRETPGTYLAFLGRISPEKGVEQAIAIARQAGMPLKIVAKVDRADREYFQQVIQPLLDDSQVQYLGEMGETDKNAFLGQAYTLLFPIDWPEPFGLVMIEALACGTPVIAYRRGSVPEVLEDGVTGWIVESCEEAVQAVTRVSTLSRVRCRQVFEERFSATRMTQDYLKIYQQLLAARPGRVAA